MLIFGSLLDWVRGLPWSSFTFWILSLLLLLEFSGLLLTCSFIDWLQFWKSNPSILTVQRSAMLRKQQQQQQRRTSSNSGSDEVKIHAENSTTTSAVVVLLWCSLFYLWFLSFFRTPQAVMNLTHQVDPKVEEIQAPLTPDQILDQRVTPSLIHQQRITATKRHPTTSPVTNSKAESLQTSKWTDVIRWRLGCTSSVHTYT